MSQSIADRVVRALAMIEEMDSVSDLKPCPCGKIPERLIVHAEHSCPKWAWVTGSCCDGWGLEFRNDYAWAGTPEQMEKATEAWNTMERAG